MIDFKISLAGLCIGVRANYASTEEFCKDYKVDEDPVFAVEVTLQDIENERQISYVQSEREKGKRIEYPNEYLERLALYRKIVVKIIDYDAFLFHSSIIAVDGLAYAFSAKSGTGKTTHTRFYLEKIEGAHVLNGDKPLLRIIDDKVYACGTPWQGKENFGINEILPLKAICLLQRGSENEIEEIKFSQGFNDIVQQAYHNSEGDFLAKSIQLILRLQNKIKVYRLKCNLDPNSAIISYNFIRDN